MCSYRLERLTERLVIEPFLRRALGGTEPGQGTSAGDVGMESWTHLILRQPVHHFRSGTDGEARKHEKHA